MDFCLFYSLFYPKNLVQGWYKYFLWKNSLGLSLVSATTGVQFPSVSIKDSKWDSWKNPPYDVQNIKI